MDFMGIGPLELLLIFIIILIVVGPGKLPEMGSTLGKTFRKLKQATYDLTKAMSEEPTESKEGEGETAGDKKSSEQ